MSPVPTPSLPGAHDGDAARALWRTRLFLAAGLLLFFLAFWKGEGGYGDLGEYLDVTERLWLKGTLALPGPAGTPAQYPRYSLGLPVLSGPLLYAGALIQEASGGAISRRAVAALTVPCAGVLAALLLFEVGRALGLAARVCFWAALMLALGSPLLSYTRLYYAEAGVVLGLLAGTWAFLQARRRDERRAKAWLVLSGLGLGGAAACHYSDAVAAAALWLGLVAALLLGSGASVRTRWSQVAALTLVPALLAAALLALNWVHYGNPFHLGYHDYYPPDKGPVFSFAYWGKNAGRYFLWLVRTPWVLPGLVGLAVLWRDRRALVAGLGLAFVAQSCFWLSFSDLTSFPLRYLEPLTALPALGLLLAGQKLAARFPARGLWYAGLALGLWNLAFFLAGDDGARSFFTDESLEPAVQCHVWYMTPFATARGGYGTPVGLTQGLVWIGLVAGAVACLWAARPAGNQGIGDRG